MTATYFVRIEINEYNQSSSRAAKLNFSPSSLLYSYTDPETCFSEKPLMIVDLPLLDLTANGIVLTRPVFPLAADTEGLTEEGLVFFCPPTAEKSKLCWALGCGFTPTYKHHNIIITQEAM